MIGKLLVLFLTISTSLAIINGEQSDLKAGKPCTVEVFESAQTVFLGQLGLPYETYNWKHALELNKKLFSLFGEKSVGALQDNPVVAICKAHVNMVSAINKAGIQAESCFKDLFFIQNDINAYEGKVFAGTFSMIRGLCSELFYPMVDNYDCIRRVFDVTKALDCLNFDPSLAANVACDVTTHITTCFMKYFKDVCKSPEISYLACELITRQMDGIYPECTDQCKVENYKDAN